MPTSSGSPRLARALGAASLGLGVAQVVAPRRVARAAGLDDTHGAPRIVRAAGARELVHAAGLLGSRTKRGTWAATRVAGDALDLAALAVAVRHAKRPRRALAATAGVVGIAALDVYAAVRERARQEKAERVHASVTINRPRAEVSAAWHATHGASQRIVRYVDAPGGRGTEVHVEADGDENQVREELRRFKQVVETGGVVVSDGNPDGTHELPKVLTVQREAQPAGRQ